MLANRKVKDGQGKIQGNSHVKIDSQCLLPEASSQRSLCAHVTRTAYTRRVPITATACKPHARYCSNASHFII